MQALLALAALLALLGPGLLVGATFGDNGLTTYTGRKREPNTLVFGNDMVTEQALQATLNFAKDVLKGTWKPVRNDPPTEKQEVELECLHSLAPEPLNWKMWCPGTDAKVYGWQDKSGAAHRQITLRPQPGMTSTMYQWFITTTVLGLMPPIVEYQGNHYHYYHLWHPLDHVESTWAVAPKVPILQKGFPVYVLIHERYRNPANFTFDRHYETNGWFYVEDAVANLAKNRYVITMPYMGIPTWTMILEFNDTPEGLVVDVEVIAGVPHKGYDDRAPKDGYKMAAGMNELFTAPLLARQRGSFDWDESINAITRHVIEEFSNLQHFVPYLYEKCNLLGKAGLNWVPTLGTWLQNNNRTADSTSISFYHTLEKLAAKQVPKNGTVQGKIIDAHMDILNHTLLAGQKVLTKINEGISKSTFVPISNKLTKLSYEINKANGARPKVDVTAANVRRNVWDKLLSMSNVTTEAMIISHGDVPPAGSAGANDTAAAGNGTATAEAGGFHNGNDEDRSDSARKPFPASNNPEDQGTGANSVDESGDTSFATATPEGPQTPPAAAPSQLGATSKPDDVAAASAGYEDDDADEGDDDDNKRQPMGNSAQPAAAGSAAPQGAQEGKSAEPAGEATTGDDEGSDDDVDPEESARANNPAWQLRQKLRDAYDEDEDAHAANDAFDTSDDPPIEALLESAQLSAAYMDALHAIAANSQPDSDVALAVSAAEADGGAESAVEVPGMMLGKVHTAIRVADTKNISGIIADVKREIHSSLENNTITFHGANNSLHLPDSVMTVMAAKHALHKGVLTALLNKTDLGLGKNVSVWTMPDAEYQAASTAEGMYGEEAYPSIDSAGTSPVMPEQPLLNALVLQKALTKGSTLQALLANASASGNNISIRAVPHALFETLANVTQQSQQAPVTAAPSVSLPQVAKPGLKGSLAKLGQSVSRAKMMAKSFRPAFALKQGNNTDGPLHAGNRLKLQAKFWGDRLG